MEDAGLKVELVSREDAIASLSSKVELRLRVLDPKKRKDKHKENEAIQFEYDIETDDADQMAQGMVRCTLLIVEFKGLVQWTKRRLFNLPSYCLP